MTTTETLTWLTEAHLECVRQYRCALEREINHVQRIYNHNLSEEVKRVLKQSLKEMFPIISLYIKSNKAGQLPTS